MKKHQLKQGLARFWCQESLEAVKQRSILEAVMAVTRRRFGRLLCFGHGLGAAQAA
jgi:hypothetical protein